LTHYLQYLKNKPYTYGRHLVPHDAAVHEYATGLSRVEVARNHGVLFTITPEIGMSNSVVGPATHYTISLAMELMLLGAGCRSWQARK
jgi:hypothetical protein